MSENRYSRHEGGRSGEPSQLNEHLSGLEPDALIDEMADQWDAMDDEHFDPDLIDAYLDQLDKKAPIEPDFNARDSLAAFREKHALLLEQMEPALKPPDTVPRPKTSCRWRIARLITAVAVVTLACMVTAQALGYDVFGIIARWTEETFRFTVPVQMEPSAIPTDSAAYKDLQEALDAYGITDTVAPAWYPPEYEMREVKVSPVSGGIRFRATYEAGEKFIAVTIWQYESAEDADNGTFEKDGAPVTSYEAGGITHYLMSNNGQMNAVWTNQNIVCSISGDLSEDELKQMIDSIYER